MKALLRKKTFYYSSDSMTYTLVSANKISKYVSGRRQGGRCVDVARGDRALGRFSLSSALAMQMNSSNVWRATHR